HGRAPARVAARPPVEPHLWREGPSRRRRHRASGRAARAVAGRADHPCRRGARRARPARPPFGRGMTRSGRLVALEGGEASGKSTQARLLATALGAVLTHEPGATPAGGRIREVVLDAALEGLDPRAEALLLAADRAQHAAEVLRPALDSGRDVVSDRFTGSSLA